MIQNILLFYYYNKKALNPYQPNSKIGKPGLTTNTRIILFVHLKVYMHLLAYLYQKIPPVSGVHVFSRPDFYLIQLAIIQNQQFL